jgi:hypothetical protein
VRRRSADAEVAIVARNLEAIRESEECRGRANSVNYASWAGGAYFYMAPIVLWAVLSVQV